jgi:hypothetical protein
VKLLLWAVAIALFVGGTVIFLVWDTSWAWWLYVAAVIPFTLLVGEKLRTDEVDPRDGGFMDGPWGPP